MSDVTNIIVTTGPDDIGICGVQNWLTANGHPPLVEVSRIPAGPRKSMECRVWIGGFNHLDLDDFLLHVKLSPWEYRFRAQVFVKEQEDQQFNEKRWWL